ncbi:hypothetical protein J6590_041244 [Homalodisca vitripennis]|nr:hypothetical protein J6590_041244 [Homalodisca vitripennis]
MTAGWFPSAVKEVIGGEKTKFPVPLVHELMVSDSLLLKRHVWKASSGLDGPPRSIGGIAPQLNYTHQNDHRMSL